MLASAAQDEAQEWKTKFEAERVLRRELNAKILDMQVRRVMYLRIVGRLRHPTRV